MVAPNTRIAGAILCANFAFDEFSDVRRSKLSPDPIPTPLAEWGLSYASFLCDEISCVERVGTQTGVH
jgi:hypothetical protein